MRFKGIGTVLIGKIRTNLSLTQFLHLVLGKIKSLKYFILKDNLHNLYLLYLIIKVDYNIVK